jgi:hypothetical protein
MYRLLYLPAIAMPRAMCSKSSARSTILSAPGGADVSWPTAVLRHCLIGRHPCHPN